MPPAKGYQITVEGLDEIEQALNEYPKIAEAAIISGLNKVAVQARNAAVKAIRRSRNIPASRLKRNLKVTRRARKGSLLAEITAVGKSAGLINYKARQIKKGVSAEVIKGDRKVHEDAFIATVLHGGRGVFKRKGPKKVPTQGRYLGRKIKRGPDKGKPLKRQPLEKLWGPSAAGLWNSIGRKAAVAYVKANMARIVINQVELGLARMNKRRARKRAA